jgi:hypothetical protein
MIWLPSRNHWETHQKLPPTKFIKSCYFYWALVAENWCIRHSVNQSYCFMSNDNCGQMHNHNLTLGYHHNPLIIYKILSKETKGHGRSKLLKKPQLEPKLSTKYYACSDTNRLWTQQLAGSVCGAVSLASFFLTYLNLKIEGAIR